MRLIRPYSQVDSASPAVASDPEIRGEEYRVQTFFVRIHPARSNFLSTIDEREREAMARHAQYWRDELAKGSLILAGPVPIEPGTFGILILRAESESDAEALVRRDPSVMAQVMNYEVYPLKVAFYEGTV